MRPTSTTTERQERLIEDLERHARGDQRVRAAWLEGSFAGGTADAGSDVDLHVAIEDERFDEFVDGAREWVAAVRAPHGDVRATFGPVRMFGWALDDYVRLDLFVERRSAVASLPRPVDPRVLFDHDGVAAGFRIEKPGGGDPAQKIADLLSIYWFGFTFPGRLGAREEWGSQHLNALLVVYQFVVPAMLAQTRPEQTFRPQLHNERLLDPAQRAAIDAVVTELASAYSTLPPDHEAVRAAHARLISLALRELKAAATAHGVAWASDAEDAVRRYFREELGIELR
jgi:hypothetical protein